MYLYANQTFVLHLRTGIDISAMTNRKILYKKPDNTIGFWTPTVETTTMVKYQILPADTNNEPGLWEAQFYGEESAGAVIRKGDIVQFVINSPIQ